MAYSVQSFAVGQVLTSPEMNQVETNIRDHAHGSAGVGGVPLFSMQRSEISNEGTGVTVPLNGSAIICTASVGNVVRGDRIHVCAYMSGTKGTTPGLDQLLIEQASGTAGIKGYHNTLESIFGETYHANGSTFGNFSIAGILKVNSTGHLSLHLRAFALGSSLSNVGGEMYALTLVGL